MLFRASSPLYYLHLPSPMQSMIRSFVKADAAARLKTNCSRGVQTEALGSALTRNALVSILPIGQDLEYKTP